MDRFRRRQRSLKKGSKVYIEGQLRTRKWEKDGVEHFSTEIAVRPQRGELTLLSGSKAGAAPDEAADEPADELNSDDIPY